MQKEDMNLEENREGHLGGFRRREGSGGGRNVFKLQAQN